MRPFRQGDEVDVRDCNGTILSREVWGVNGEKVFLCSARDYDKLINADPEAIGAIGFPLQDVVQPAITR